MVRRAELRKRRFEQSIHPGVISQRFAAQKEIMTEQQAVYFSEIAEVEAKVKSVCEAAGVPTIQVRDYVNVGRKCYSIAKRFSQATRDQEAQRVVTHWAARGLDGPLLAKACLAGGCNVTEPPSVCYNPCLHGMEKHAFSLPNSIADLETRDHHLLTGLGDDDHLQYALATKARPIPWVAAADLAARSIADLGTRDHHLLTGLADDDHTQYVLRNILTTHGDLFFRDAAVIQRLAPGVAGQVLITQGAGANPVWGDVPAHASRHQDGGVDEISVAGLSGLLADAQKVQAQDEGVLVGTRKTLNFTGAGVTASDDVPNDRVNVNIPGVAAHASTHIDGGSDEINAPLDSNALPELSVGTYVLEAANAEKGTTSTGYVKMKEIVLGRAGALTIYFEIKVAPFGYTAYGRIYKNGSAVGTERSTGSTTYVGFSENITGLAVGDLIQLYCKVSAAGGTTYCIRYQLKCAWTIAGVTLD